MDRTRALLAQPGLTGPVLLSGTQGVGKFGFLLEALAEALPPGCVTVVGDGLDGVREAVSDCAFLPGAAFRAVVVRDAHMMSEPAQDGLLKALEEAPRGSTFFVVADDPGWMAEPILSRMRTEVRWGPVSDEELRELSSDELAIRSSFGSAADCVAATATPGLRELYAAASAPSWPRDALLGRVPKVLKDVGSDRRLRRCVSNVLRLAARGSANPAHLLRAASSIARLPSLNASNCWLSAASAAMM
jgi:hypothetical protein